LLTAAARYRDRMPPVERVLLDRLEAVRARDVEAVFQTAQQMNRIAPNSMLTGYVVAAVAANRPREALKAHARRNLSDSILKGEALYWRWLATARHMVGDYQQELEETRLRREEQPELMGPLFVEARALAGLGRVADVERVLEETLTMPRQDFTPGAVMLHTAVELRAHGHRDAAVRVLAKALAWHATRPPAAPRALRETLARTYYEAEQWDAARPVFEELAREEPRNIMYLGYLGALAARRGDRREVERITARLAAVPDSQQLPNQLLWRARMAALLGTPDQALELLREAIAEGLRYDLWLHTDRDLDSLREYGAFKKLARPRG
jgi:tetratricopeptide (TPR) repeat protein